jgi:hypothetical protein
MRPACPHGALVAHTFRTMECMRPFEIAVAAYMPESGTYAPPAFCMYAPCLGTGNRTPNVAATWQDDVAATPGVPPETLHKKMLKMKVAPKMLLKIKGVKRQNVAWPIYI